MVFDTCDCLPSMREALGIEIAGDGVEIDSSALAL
jgi:hypothetical protein